MRLLPPAVVALLVLGAGCAARVPPAATPTAPAGPTLASADAMVRAGCYDCLVDALAAYRRIAAASPGGIVDRRIRDTAALLAIRERDLGLDDQHYLEQARRAAPDAADAFVLDVIATLPRRFAGRNLVGSEAELQAMLAARRNRDAWRGQLQEVGAASALGAVASLSFECLYRADPDAPAIDTILERIGDWRATPLVAFTAATCASFDTGRLASLVQDEPRFAELNYFLGIAATLKGDLDEADSRFRQAFAWREDWPAVTMAIGNVAMTAEDFDRAEEFYERTLALSAGNPDAALGRVRALSYGGKYVAAIDAANEMLAAGRWYVGDAHYWRAWNETQLNRNEPAWDDVHEAAKLLINADVYKLTGVLAVRRGDLPTARTQFQEAHARNEEDCETATLLGGVHLELRDWRAAMPVLSAACACLDRHDADLRADIERLRAKGRGRIVARREQEIASDQQLRTQSWFNLAVAAMNAGDTATARSYAERLTADERYGERARQLLRQVKP